VKVSAFSLPAGQADISKQVDLQKPTTNYKPQIADYRLLKPGQQASIFRQFQETHKIKVQTVDVEEAIAWKKGELILNDVTMAEAARIIGRWYNVQVTFKDTQLTTCRITVSFLKGETIQEAMDVISGYNNFTWQMKKDKITISGNGCP
jgi:ferric-dicitrate binding protein FerR (iron transport regulator)